jgi:hypothetical protein
MRWGGGLCERARSAEANFLGYHVAGGGSSFVVIGERQSVITREAINQSEVIPTISHNKIA